MQRRGSIDFLSSSDEMGLYLSADLDNQKNESEKAFFIKMLKRIINDQLTTRQKHFIVLYYFKKLDMKTIAKHENVNKSTVSRSISRSKQIIFNYLQYYFK